MRPPSFPTLPAALRSHAEQHGSRCACTFLREGEHEEASWSYADLDRRARAIGAQLRAAGAAGERVLLLYPAGLEFLAAFMGCLYAGAVAVPAHPPRWERHLPRLLAMVQDAQPRFLLSTAAFGDRLGPLIAGTPLGELHRLASDTASATEWRPELPPPGSLAFLQYTSGSTAQPKGVMVSHGNLTANHRMQAAAFEQEAGSVIVTWLPLFHDMGLIGNALQSIYLGARTILMSPEAFLVKPVRWLRAISRYGAHTSGGPNFAYDHCARRISEEQKSGLDLGCWEVAFNGAEPVRAETLERFTQAFAPCGFRRQAWYPCYGLAEATLFAAGGAKSAPPRVEETRRLVGCGRAWGESRLEIVQAESGRRCAPGEVGEVWLAGPHVAQGYWQRPLASAETFQACLADGGGPYLRTGDLGLLADGELFLTGRCKDLLIVAGRNHYPNDLEQTVEACHPALRLGGSAAIGVEVEGEERLVILAEVERRHRREADWAGLERSIRQAIAEEHGLGTHALLLLKPGALPKTSSGKIQRYACRETYCRGLFAELQA